jgi:hypothetical protein
MNFIKKMFSPMPDDMSTTRYHAQQIARRLDIPEYEGEIVRGATEFNGIVIDSTEKALDFTEAQ